MKKASIILILLISSAILFAQEAEGTKLFPTRLTINSTDTAISLSWKQAGQGETGYSLYRYTEPITSDNFSSAEKISEIPAGTTSFEDYPPARDVPYFYAVLAVDANGEENEIFIPFGNINLYGISILYIQRDDEDLVKISGLSVKEDNGTALLSFSAEPSGREILIYRDTKPIRTSEDLLDAILIDRVSSGVSRYTDTPISGVDYYYALIGSRAFKKGDILFEEGETTTSSPLILPTKDNSIYSIDADFSLRSRPLPYLSSGTVYQNRISSTIMERTSPAVLENELQVDIDDFISTLSVEKVSEPAPVILGSDIDENSPGWDSRLSTILSSEFISGNYEETLNQLLRFQKLPATREMEYRVHFYLGQTYYFLGDYKKSLVEFIFAEENFFTECKPWMKLLFEVSDLIDS